MKKRKFIIMTFTAMVMAVSLSGCGVKSAPAKPEGSTYPGVYPYIPETETPEAGVPSITVEL